MHDDLTYRQQRNLNLISEALLSGRTELVEQAGREAAMLNEQFSIGRSAEDPKLTIDTPMGPATIDPSDVPDSMRDTDAAGGDVDDVPDSDAGEADLLRNIDDTLDDLLGIEGGRKEGGSISDNNILLRRLRAARRKHMKEWKAANPDATKQEKRDERRKFTQNFIIRDVVVGLAIYTGATLPSVGGGSKGGSGSQGGGGNSGP